MGEISRLQVRKDAAEYPWSDVGHDSTHEKVPVTLYDSSGNPITSLPISIADPVGVENVAGIQINPATSENQDTQITNSKIFSLNHVDDYTTTNVVYLGSETNSGEWKILKIDQTGNFPVFTYASVANNPTLTSYTLGWAARTTATYNVYSTAF